MIVAGWILFAFALARLLVALLNRIGNFYLPPCRPCSPCPPERAEVSVLIPARNEERNIGRLLQDLAEAGAGIREILVYDDRSTDATADIVRRFSRTNPAIRLVPGGELPEGWLGKNHACHRLAQQAAGRYLLFLDADVRIRPQGVVRALRYVERSGVALLSLFPRQLMPDRGTRLAVPLMNWILLSLLPLAAVLQSPLAALCAANGQFLLFDAAVYAVLRPHETFRRSPVEDMAIAGHYKRCGQRVAVLLGRDDVACRMYSSLREAVAGFSRNVFDFFGGSEALCYAFTIATTAAPFVVFACLGPLPGVLYLVAIVLLRMFVSSASRQSIAWNLVLLVPQQLVLWWIVVTASVRKRKKRLLWKGRNIYLPE